MSNQNINVVKSDFIKSNYAKSFALTGLALALSGCITVNASSLDYKETKTLNLDASEIKTLKIDFSDISVLSSGTPSGFLVKIPKNWAKTLNSFKIYTFI